MAIPHIVDSWVLPYRDLEKENLHVASVLVDAPDLRRVLSAWENMPLSWDGPDDDPKAAPADLDDRWEWLWEHTGFDLEVLSQRAQVGRRRVRALVESLRGNRLIYPSRKGRMPQAAVAYLQSVLANAAQPKRRKASKQADKA